MNDDERIDLDFEKSLQTGLRLAQEIENAVGEIQNVLVHLDKVIRKGTDEAISIIVQKPRRTPMGQFLGLLESFRSATVIHVDSEDEEPEELEVLARITPTNDNLDTRKICSISWSDEGYPVTIDSGTQIEACHDAVSLRKALADILGRPTTGRKIKALIKRDQDRRANDAVAVEARMAESLPAASQE